MTLAVTVPAQFVPERRYIVDVLLREFLGFPYELRTDTNATSWRIEHAGKRLVIEDQFFGQFADGERYADARTLPDAVHRVASPFFEAPVVGLFGVPELAITADEIRCKSDLFAAAFFMLTRWEEAVAGERDEHARFPARASLAKRHDFLQRAVVNEWTEWLANAIAHLGYSAPRKQRRFEIVPSHDLDHPFYWQWRTGFVEVVGDLVRRRDTPRALRNARDLVATKLGRRKDPYDTTGELMTRSEQAGVVSQFNVMTGGDTPHDPRHEYDTPAIRSMLEAIVKRGHHVGFHPSYAAYDDTERFGAELATLRSMAPAPIAGGREHYLRFAAPLTWRIWDEHGLKVDSTLGFAEEAGFRTGCCYSYPVFDFERRKPLALVEQPLLAMDVTFVNYRELSPEATRQALAALRTTVERFSGELTILWHNSSLTGTWTPYRPVYEQLLIPGSPET
jgi:hypothetical protein